MRGLCLSAVLAAMLATAAPAYAQDAATPTTSDPLFSYLSGECFYSAVTAVAIGAVMPAALGPMTISALGGVPGASMLGAAVMGCTAGAAAGVVSAGLNVLWTEREPLGEATTRQASAGLEAGQAALGYAADTIGASVASVGDALGDVLAEGQGALAGAAQALAGWWRPASPQSHHQAIELAALPEADEGQPQRGALY